MIMVLSGQLLDITLNNLNLQGERMTLRIVLGQAWVFIKEVFMFGLDAAMAVIGKEIARRFWKRLANRGGAYIALDEHKTSTQKTYGYAASSGQSQMSFLDEYRDS
jgi:hypothetical protein